jgi:hypothetical protein
MSVGSAYLFKIGSRSFVLNRERHPSARDIALHLFLLEEGENLKDAYVSYLYALKLDSQDTAKLSQLSWRSPDRKLWPDISSLCNIQNSIGETALANQLNIYTLKEAHDKLRRSVIHVMRISTMAMFNGKEYLLERVLREIDNKLNRLSTELVRYHADDDRSKELDFTLIEKPLKDAAHSTVNLLKALCKIADGIAV